MTIKARLWASLLAFSLAGCVAGPELRVPLTAHGSERLDVTWLHAYPHKQGVLVLGHVKRTTNVVRPIAGHLHVTGFFTDDAPPVVVDAQWAPLPKRAGRMAAFAAILTTSRPDRIGRIDVEHRAQQELDD